MKLLIENIKKYNKINYIFFLFQIKKEKKIKIKKLLKKEDKQRSILGEKLLIEGLKYYNINYKKNNITTNEYGKPYINGIYYNISHKNDYVICALDKNEIGIDIEKIRKININNINQYTTENEKKYILENNNYIYERAFEIYTLKEAYFKMKGTNLNNIKNIEFTIKNNKIKCSDKTVNLKLIKYIENYVIAICIKNQ